MCNIFSGMFWLQVWVSDSKMLVDICTFKVLQISRPVLIVKALAKYKDIAFIVKATAIAKGIKSINDWSCSINSFLIAGSNNQAMAAVPPATAKENIRDKNNLPKCFLT